MKTILITGASGFIGQKLTRNLQENGFFVKTLSRSQNKSKNSFIWNPDIGEIDENSLLNTDVIINLAGAGIAEKRWTIQRKEQIYNSRITALNLLYKKCTEINYFPAVLISASAVGYYGFTKDNRVFTEESEPGNGFLPDVCVNWEKAAEEFGKKGSRVVKLRIPAVLGADGGALKKMLPLFRLGLGSAVGSGKQIFPFIYIKDLMNIFNFVIKNDKLQGNYNTVSPENITNYEFSEKLAKNLKTPFFMPNVPVFVLKLIFGEMSEILLEGNAVSGQKIEDAGFEFQFKKTDLVLEDIFGGN